MRLAAGCGNEVLVFGVTDAGLELRARADGTRVFAGSAEGRIVGWDRDGKQVVDVDAVAVKPAGGP